MKHSSRTSSSGGVCGGAWYPDVLGTRRRLPAASLGLGQGYLDPRPAMMHPHPSIHTPRSLPPCTAICPALIQGLPSDTPPARAGHQCAMQTALVLGPALTPAPSLGDAPPGLFQDPPSACSSSPGSSSTPPPAIPSPQAAPSPPTRTAGCSKTRPQLLPFPRCSKPLPGEVQAVPSPSPRRCSPHKAVPGPLPALFQAPPPTAPGCFKPPPSGAPGYFKPPPPGAAPPRGCPGPYRRRAGSRPPCSRGRPRGWGRCPARRAPPRGRRRCRGTGWRSRPWQRQQEPRQGASDPLDGQTATDRQPGQRRRARARRGGGRWRHTAQARAEGRCPCACVSESATRAPNAQASTADPARSPSEQTFAWVRLRSGASGE